MKTIKGLVVFVVTGTILAVIAYGLFVFSRNIYERFVGLEIRDQTMLLFLFVAVALIAWVLLKNSKADSMKSDGGVLLSSKIQLYLKLLDSLQNNMGHNFSAVIFELRNELLLLASEQVLDKLMKIEYSFSERNISQAALDAEKSQLIKAMRSDLGQAAGFRIQALEDFRAATDSEQMDGHTTV
jgi:hypothetical protein